MLLLPFKAMQTFCGRRVVITRLGGSLFWVARDGHKPNYLPCLVVIGGLW